jgi:glycosyltransferase involved in cell wall biosynthesis
LLRNAISSFVQREGVDFGFDSIHWFHRYVLRNADLLLPNSWNEGHLLVNHFKVDPKKIHPVPIGVDEKFARAKPDKFAGEYGINDFLLFVGRIDKNKNVLNLIKAYKRTGLETKLVIIGHTSNKEYLGKCLKAAEGDKNVIFCGFMPHDSDLLSSAYAAAKALILPSWFETPGIVALEAGLAGANVAITKIGGTTEYFKSLAFYIDPYKLSSIEKAIVQSYLKEKTSDLREHILDNYTMEKITKPYIEAYEKALI